MRVNTLLIGVTAVAMLSASPAFGEEAGSNEEGKIYLQPLEISETKDLTQRITQTDMERINASNLWESMQLAPGVTLLEIGGRNDYRVNIRGFSTSQIRVMLDDIPVYIPYDGYEDISRFLIQDLETIEVSKGYSSALTGAGAMGGVINLVSARPTKDFEFKARYLNYFDSRFEDMARATQASVGTKQDLFFVKASGIFVEQDFFRTSDSFDGSITYPTGIQNQPRGKRKNSGYRDRKLNIMAGLTPTEESEIVVGWIAQRGSKEQPPYAGRAYSDPSVSSDANSYARSWSWPTWDKDSVYLSTKFSPFDDFYVKGNIYHDTYENELFDYDGDMDFRDKYSKSRYNDYAYGGRLEAGYKFNEMHSVAMSGSYRFNSHIRTDWDWSNASDSWINNSRTAHYEEEIWTAGLEYTLKLMDDLTLVFGGSYIEQKPKHTFTDADVLGNLSDKGNGADAWDGQAALFYDINENHTVYASFASKTHMPTLQDRYRVRYRRGSLTMLPNPDLDPERALHYEVGYRGTIHNSVNFGASLFYSDVKDLIAISTVPNPSGSGTLDQNQNLDKASFRGIELTTNILCNEYITFGGTFSYLHWNLRGQNTSDTNLTYLPEFKANAYAVITPFPGLSLIPRWEYQAGSYYEEDSTRFNDKTKSVSLLHFKAVYNITENFSVEAGVTNLLDSDYEYAEGYPLAGRTFFGGVTVEF